MSLPKNNEIIQAESINPYRMVLFSFPKCGKSELCLNLKNSILIDIENSTKSFNGTKVVVSTFAQNLGKSKLGALKYIADELKKDKRDYVILDTVTEIEELASEYAIYLYKNSLQGRNYQGNNIIGDLGQNGYQWTRQAFEEILGWFEGTFNKGIIYLCHIKLASISKGEKDIQVKDLFLTGKNKTMIAKDCDAIGLLYRNKDNLTQNIVSFKTNPNDVISGARSKHLSNQEFVISEKLEDGTLKTYWDKVYLPDETK